MTLVSSEYLVNICKLFYVFGVAFKTQAVYVLLVEGVHQKNETTLSIVFEELFSVTHCQAKRPYPPISHV